MDATIYHNARCGTSRSTLALLREAGIEPVIVDYLVSPPSKDALRALSVGAALREKEAAYATLGLANPTLSDDALLGHMVDTPILIDRPFVTTPLGTRLCRPPETVLDILPGTQAR